MNTLFIGVTQFLDQHRKYVEVFDPFINIPLVLKPIRILWFKLNLPFFGIWVKSDLKKRLAVNRLVILAATPFTLKLINRITRQAPLKTTLILWYWNPIEKLCNPSDLPKRWKQISFDKVDAAKYGISYKNTYYFKEFVEALYRMDNLNHFRYDLFFLGLDKGRSNNLLNLVKDLKLIDIELYCYIVKDNTSSNSEVLYQAKLSYDKVLEKISQAKALLDFNQEGQTGLTLRAMEGLFFEKKIVTNNRSILGYDFYNSQNIFILGVDSLDDLKGFLNTPYKQIPESIKNQYLFSNWLNVIENEF